MKKILCIVWCVLCLVTPKAQAESAFSESQFQALNSQVGELSNMIRELKLVVENQQKEIQILKGRSSGTAMPTLQSQTPLSGPVIKKILPEIGVVADMAARLDSPKTDGEGADRLQVRELEIVLGAAVDPWTRLDSTIAVTEDEGAELEEAYMTRYGLPLDLTMRAGRLKPRVGKALPVHRDSLDTVDEPLVIQRYFGIEGMAKTGVDLKRQIEMPWAMTHEAVVGVLEGGNGEEGTLFGSTRRRPTLYSHLKNGLDLSDVTSLEIGLSHMAGSRDADSEWEVHVLGLDGTLIHHFNATQNIKLQGEVYNVNRTETLIEITDEATGEIVSQDLDGNIYGGYALVDVRFHPRWSTGFRFDDVQLVDRPVDSRDHADIGYTGYLTFYQSEFARFRLQVSHFDLTSGADDNQVMLQGTFAIGEHKHKIQ